MIFAFLPVLFCALLHFVDTSAPKQHRRKISASDQQDLDYVLSRLQKKFSDALSSKPSQRLSWSQVEIGGGWPSSVYYLNPCHWCDHDIKVLKKAIDSIEIRALQEEQEDAPPADHLHAQLMVECERLKLLKTHVGAIDWKRIAANIDGIRITNANFRKWNSQDRRMIQRLIENLKNISDSSAMRECALVNKHSEEMVLRKLRKGWNIGKKRKAVLIESAVDDDDELDGENKSEQEGVIDVDETTRTNDAEYGSQETEDDLVFGISEPQIQAPIIFGLPVPDSPFVELGPTTLPSFHQTLSELLVSRYFDILFDSIEDSQLKSIVQGCNS